MEECFCIICKKFIGTYYKSQIRKTCSSKCKSILISKQVKGINNPNYRHGKHINKNYCKNCGKEIDYRSIHCPKCNPINPFQNKTHSNKSKKLIGKKSKERYTKEYKQKIRMKNESLGYWIPLHKLSAYKKYYRECEWDNFIELTNNFNLVRDHKYSRYDGFKNNINPLILKHPVNCEILTRSENISKGSNSSITLKELYKLIKNYKGNWIKHKECKCLIGGA